MQMVNRLLGRWLGLRVLLAFGVLGGSALLGGCGGGTNSPATTGRAEMVFTWPTGRSFSRLIPLAANSIKVSFTQSGVTIATQTVARPAGGGTSTLTFASLPAGTYSVTAQAFPSTDATGVAQASATVSATIIAGQTTSISITMASTIDRFALTPA